MNCSLDLKQPLDTSRYLEIDYLYVLNWTFTQNLEYHNVEIRKCESISLDAIETFKELKIID